MCMKCQLASLLRFSIQAVQTFFSQKSTRFSVDEQKIQLVSIFLSIIELSLTQISMGSSYLILSEERISLGITRRPSSSRFLIMPVNFILFAFPLIFKALACVPPSSGSLYPIGAFGHNEKSLLAEVRPLYHLSVRMSIVFLKFFLGKKDTVLHLSKTVS